MLLDVDRGEAVAAHHRFADQNGVFVVAALPGQEGHDHVLAQGQFAVARRGAIGQHVADDHPLAAKNDRVLVDARALVRAVVLSQLVSARAVLAQDDDLLARHADDLAHHVGQHNLAGVERRLLLHARADHRHVRLQQRHGLALHVRTHQGAVGVVVLQEGDQRGRDADDLPRGHVHEVDALHRGEAELLVAARGDARGAKLAALVDLGVGLGDGEVVFLVGRHVGDFFGQIWLNLYLADARLAHLRHVLGRHRLARADDDLARAGVADGGEDVVVDHLVADGHLVEHAPVGCLDETVLIDTAVSRQTADEADVRPFRRLDGADAAVVAVVHVAHLEAGALAPQTAGAKGRQGALVGQLGQRVGLLHELAELRAAEELANGGHDRANVDQRHGRHVVALADRHALAHDPLHAPQTDAQLGLDQLADGLHAAIAQVVDVVGPFVTVVDQDHVPDEVDDVLLRDGAVGQGHDALHVQPLVELVAADGGQVIAPAVVQLLVQVLRGVVERRRVAGAHALVELDQRLLRDRLVRVPMRLLLDAALDIEVLAVGVHVGEQGQQLLVGAFLNKRVVQTVGDGGHGPQKERHRNRALAVEFDGQVIRLARLELHPCAAVGDELAHRQRAARGALLFDLEVSAGRANELADDDALRAVDDEGAGRGHEREVAHEDVLDDGLVDVAAIEHDAHVERRGVAHIALHALLDIVLGLAEPVAQVETLDFGPLAGEEKLEVAIEAFNRRDLVKKLRQSLGNELLE